MIRTRNTQNSAKHNSNSSNIVTSTTKAEQTKRRLTSLEIEFENEFRKVLLGFDEGYGVHGLDNG